jgi:hypothetical protein
VIALDPLVGRPEPALAELRVLLHGLDRLVQDIQIEPIDRIGGLLLCHGEYLPVSVPVMSILTFVQERPVGVCRDFPQAD